MGVELKKNGRQVVISRDHLDLLFRALTHEGFGLIGPTVRDGAIIYDSISSSADLPVGWSDDQDAGTYRLRRRDDPSLFAFATGPHSWKKYLSPAATVMWEAKREQSEFVFSPPAKGGSGLVAFIGVRACDLAAIRILDRVYLGGPYRDPGYAARREKVFILAVNCTEPGGTCFCASMKTGPRAGEGFDLALTEIVGPERHEFLIEIGSQRAAKILSDVPHRDAAEPDTALVAELLRGAESRMGRTLDTTDLPGKLVRGRDHAHWDAVAKRCLACGNCTMVCPTCFCTTVADSTDLCTSCSMRTRLWDSCFSLDFSYIHGGVVRSTVRSRYRQWLSHKLGTWVDQFGTIGCVGCGRCITWCPAQIDITEEAGAVTTPPGR